MNRRISKAVTALYDFAKNRDLVFSNEAEASIGNGIIAEAILKGLDPTDEGQRKKAAKSLLGKVNWEGMYQSSCDLAETRTEQLCEEITVSKEIVATLLLAAGGKGGVSVGGGGGGSNNELTNWDGTKKKKGEELVERVSYTNSMIMLVQLSLSPANRLCLDGELEDQYTKNNILTN